MKSKKKLDLTKVRTRYEPPTIEEAIFAAQGITSNIEHQVKIAAELMGPPESEVRVAMLQAGATVTRSTRTRVAEMQRSDIAERRGTRVSMKPSAVRR